MIFRSEVFAQVTGNKKYFTDYKSFAEVPFQTFIELQNDQEQTIRKVDNVKHQYLINENGVLKAYDLPISSQMSPIFGLAQLPLNADQYQDILASSNLSYSREFWGTYNALRGISLLNTGTTLPLNIGPDPMLKGDSRSIVGIWLDGKWHNFTTRVNQPMLDISINCPTCWHFQAEAADKYAIIRFKDGTQRREEFYFGNSFRGQSSRSLVLADSTSVASIEVWTNSGKRTIEIKTYE